MNEFQFKVIVDLLDRIFKKSSDGSSSVSPADITAIKTNTSTISANATTINTNVASILTAANSINSNTGVVRNNSNTIITHLQSIINNNLFANPKSVVVATANYTRAAGFVIYNNGNSDIVVSAIPASGSTALSFTIPTGFFPIIFKTLVSSNNLANTYVCY